MIRSSTVGLILFSVFCTSAATAQQLFVQQTASQCAARGGQIITWTNTAGNGVNVGECYVRPRAGGGSGGGYYSGGTGRAAAALGAASLFLNVMTLAMDQSEIARASAPTTTGVWVKAPWYREFLADINRVNAGLDRQTSELQRLVRSAEGKPRPEASCAGYPRTEAGLAQCFKDIAAALEERSWKCADEACSAALLRNAAAARCTAAFAATAADIDLATRLCARAPGDYERLYARLYEDRIAIQQLRKDLAEARRKWQESGESGDESPNDTQRIHPDCYDTANPSVCTLVRRVDDANKRGYKTNTPFNCGRAGGQWDGDIVQGRCRLPGDTSPRYDARREADVVAANFRRSLAAANIARATGKDDRSRMMTLAAEREFATLVGLVSSLPHTEGQKLIDENVQLFYRFIGTTQ